MAGTYSKYDNDAYYSLSSRLLLSDSGTQSYAFDNNYVYTDLKDNESKLISPKMLRDAILSIWDTTPFKETSIGTNAYIGVDSGDDSNNKDLKTTQLLSSQTISLPCNHFMTNREINYVVKSVQMFFKIN